MLLQFRKVSLSVAVPETIDGRFISSHIFIAHSVAGVICMTHCLHPRDVNCRKKKCGTTTRMVFGYAYPAYECFKSVEKNKTDIEQHRFWCQYWILVVVLTVCERIGDTFVSWARDIVVLYWQRAVSYGQTRVFDFLQYTASQSTPKVYSSFLLCLSNPDY
ncbi:hypothetical protein OSB04_006580 [Centaurea solstitialis]|uniref:HVA22-like protein n=1 Tax=Centaurea solstitialis TaxID=347529 RepID=A0AA38TI62_9ASTR|nr:hypothetical protein OSB04_006580 [Centaurea solstitialis]